MATERQLQFRVGLLVILAVSICLGLVISFGDARYVCSKRYSLTIQLDHGAGLYPTAPVLLSGLAVGSVRQIDLNPRHGVNVRVEIQEGIRLPVDSRVVVSRSLLGETCVEFVRGTATDVLEPGSSISGIAAVDPIEMIQRLEVRTVATLNAFSETSQEWRDVAKNINNLMDTKRGNLDEVVERAAESLHQFTVTMKNANQMIATANKLVSDPVTQQAMQDTLLALPKLVGATKTTIDETRQTVASTRQVVDTMNRNLVSLSQVTEPLGKRGEQMVSKLDSSLKKFDEFMTELNHFAKVVNQKDGSLQKFVSDPSLHDQLVRSSESANVLMKNLEPVLKDLREFSDKVARNPEVLGLGGAVRPSTGLKDAELRTTPRTSSPPRTIVRGNNSTPRDNN
jgi:phospholipid/cholesterol/gamma-HCH transport system substrate-binding protein